MTSGGIAWENAAESGRHDDREQRTGGQTGAQRKNITFKIVQNVHKSLIGFEQQRFIKRAKSFTRRAQNLQIVQIVHKMEAEKSRVEK